jgi:hypothetical protein
MQPFTGDDAHIAALTSAYAALVAVLHEAGAVDRRAVAEALRRLAASYEPSQPAVGADLTRIAEAVERGGQAGPPA